MYEYFDGRYLLNAELNADLHVHVKTGWGIA